MRKIREVLRLCWGVGAVGAAGRKECRDLRQHGLRPVAQGKSGWSLLTELAVSRGDGSYNRLLTRLSKAEVLVLDDWGLTPLSAAEKRELLEVIEDRCQTGSTLVTSQLPGAQWHGAMGDPSVTDAILDRLVHHAHRIDLRGESMRKVKNKPATQEES